MQHEDIRYLINGVDHGIAYRNVAKGENINYKLMVCMDIRARTEIEILSFNGHLPPNKYSLESIPIGYDDCMHVLR